MGCGTCADGQGTAALRGSASACGGHAALHHQALLIIEAIGVDQGLLIVLVEEVFRREGLDLVVDPVEQRLISLGYRGSNGVLAAQGRNAHRVARVLQRVCDHFGVVIGPCRRVAVLNRVFRVCVGVVLLKLDFGVVLDQVIFRGRSGDDNHFVIGAKL